ncbi:hypothetical protein [uncultured Aquimarina sp.]|uniref:hypothetical protein n=1 Tax=uncultured Aquimarina sp. TaxID=575652 RepID=UPI00261B7D9D|nr:hypothetical protein [uncultured Aquimarina sp.]
MKKTTLIIALIAVTFGANSQITELPNGYIGIGTTTPISRLQIEDINPGGEVGITIKNKNATIGTKSVIDFVTTTTNTKYGSLGIENTALGAGAMTFSTRGGDFEKMRITSNGNIGIGTTTPNEKLEVNGGLRITNPNINKSWRLIPNEDNSFSIKETGFSGAFNISGNGGLNENLMNLKNGKIGIGTTNPLSTLFISGTNQVEGPSIPKVLAVADPSDITKTISLGYDKNIDAGVMVSVDQGTGWKNTLIQPHGGNVGIGTINPGAWKLAVNGKIRAKEIKVETGWSDFVFYDNYKLPTLKEVENHIEENGHLKDIPSAKEVEENGIFLGEMDSKLLQKIEELTLYTIQQQKEIEVLKDQNKKLLELQSRLEKLESEK